MGQRGGIANQAEAHSSTQIIAFEPKIHGRCWHKAPPWIALIKFHTENHAKAPTITNFDEKRSVSELEMITDRPLAMLKAPMTQGS